MQTGSQCSQSVACHVIQLERGGVRKSHDLTLCHALLFFLSFKMYPFSTLLLLLLLPPLPPPPLPPPERKLVESSRKVSSRPKPLSILRSLEEKYVAAMKKLQFGEYFVLLEKLCCYCVC